MCLEYRGNDLTGPALHIPRPHRADVPVLRLVACRAERGHDDGIVPWPCITEDLQQRIEEEGS